jgi:hypothetical protein
MQIRIWYEYGRPNTRHIVIIKKDGDWKAQLHTIEVAFKDDNSPFVSKREIAHVNPKMGWDRFIDSLIKLDIVSLPDRSLVPGMNVKYNVGVVNVEIAKKNYYRFYSYQPSYYTDKFLEAKKMEKILQLVAQELGFKMLDEILLNTNFVQSNQVSKSGIRQLASIDHDLDCQ